MEKVLFVTLTLSLLLSNCDKACVTEPPFKNTTINVGKVEWKTPVQATFQFEEISKCQYKIKTLNSDCTCTVSNIERKLDKRVIEVSYENQILGAFQTKVQIFDNTQFGSTFLVLRGVAVRKN